MRRMRPRSGGHLFEVIPSHPALAFLDLVHDLQNSGVDRGREAVPSPRRGDLRHLHVHLGLAPLEPQVPSDAHVLLYGGAHRIRQLVERGFPSFGNIVARREGVGVELADLLQPPGL